MIIIDEGASGKLIQTLKAMTDLDTSYCLRLYAAAEGKEPVRAVVVAQAQEHLPDANLYICEDGEALLLVQDIAPKECRKALLAIAEALAIQPAEKVGELYDLGVQIGELMILLQTKVDHQHRAEEILAKQREQREAAERAAQKRKAVLELPDNVPDINAQRRKRSHPELMIIEDDPFSRRLVENVVAKKYHLTELASAEDALSTYADLAPDVLFLDINLPNVTGHELLEKIITLDPKAYVVMLSGNADRTNVMQAMQHGAAGFVAKPFSRDRLFQYIERCPTIVKENIV